MESHNIEKLLEKYFEANTTVAEEVTLREYFAKENVPPHLAQYAPMFQYLSQAKEERFTKQVPIKTGRRKQLFRWASIAAVVVLFAGVYFTQTMNQTTSDPQTLEEIYTPEEIASAEEALSLLAINFKKGTDQIEHLHTFETSTSQFLTNK